MVSDAALFVDRTRRAFAGHDFFADEFLRDPEAYYFRSDRLSGYDLLGNHGLAVGDVDDDGWEDVYYCVAGGLPNRLFLRQPDGGTREAAHEWRAAYLDPTRSALIVDLDGDGRRDLLLAIRSNVALCWNEGGSFSRPELLSTVGPEEVFGLSVADVDRDGDLDLFACRYSSEGVMRGYPAPYHDATNGAPNVLWRNLGGRRFEDATAALGLDEENHKYSFSALFEDLDDDGDPDLYVSNDFGRNHYYRNDEGRFSDVASEIGAEDMAAGMGATSGDVDGDGDLDLYVSNIYAAEGLRITGTGERFLGARPAEMLPRYQRHARGNTLLSNRGDGTYEDRSVESGLNRAGWAWGGRLLDADNDGDLDAYVPNGFLTGSVPDADEFFWRFVVARSPSDARRDEAYRGAWMTIQYLAFEKGVAWNGNEANAFFLGEGGGRFRDASGVSGADLREDGRSVAALDWDRDGFLDLVLRSRDAPRLRLLRNQGAPRADAAWLILELVGAPGNRDAIGAQALVRAGGRTVRASVIAGDGFVSQTSRRLHFGLGAAEVIDEVEVRWPDGTRQRLERGFEPRKAWRVTRGEPQPAALDWTPVAALALDDGPPLEELPGANGRVVLCDKLPMAAIPLPGFAAAGRRVRDLTGRPLLVCLWKSRDDAGAGQLRRFARERARLAAAGVDVVPLSLDEGADLALARRLSQELGFALAGALDGWLLQVYEFLLLEIFHRTEQNPVPTSLLLDKEGQLCVVYQGPLRVERLLADVEILGRMDARYGTCARLQGGQWVIRPRRDLDSLAAALDQMGYADLAVFFRSPQVHLR